MPRVSGSSIPAVLCPGIYQYARIEIRRLATLGDPRNILDASLTAEDVAAINAADPMTQRLTAQADAMDRNEVVTVDATHGRAFREVADTAWWRSHRFDEMEISPDDAVRPVIPQPARPNGHQTRAGRYA